MLLLILRLDDLLSTQRRRRYAPELMAAATSVLASRIRLVGQARYRRLRRRLEPRMRRHLGVHLGRDRHRPRRHAAGRGRRGRPGRVVGATRRRLRVLADRVGDSSRRNGPRRGLGVGAGRRVRGRAAHGAAVDPPRLGARPLGDRRSVAVHRRRRRRVDPVPAAALVRSASRAPRRCAARARLLAGCGVAGDVRRRCELVEKVVCSLVGLPERSLRAT